MKKILFWVTFPFIASLMMVIGFLSIIPCTYLGLLNVCHELATRWEHYAFDYDQKFGNLTLWQAFKEGF